MEIALQNILKARANQFMLTKIIRGNFVGIVPARILAIGFAAIASAHAQESPVPIAPPAYRVVEPANRNLDASLYVQTAAEYRACCYQAYNLAVARLKEKRNK